MGWFDENAPPQQDWFTANAPSPTPTAVADTGEWDGFLAKINAALGGKEGVPERPSHLGTEAGAAAPEGTPFVHGFGETASHVVPQSWGELGGLAESFFPPIEAYRQTRQGLDIATGTPPEEAIPGISELKDLEDIKTQYGGDSPEYQAAAGKAAGNVLSQMIMAGMIGKGLDVPPRSYVRDTPLAPEPPPTVSQGPGTIAGDVSRALERRFTLQPTPPEAPPQLAPAPPIEQTLPNIGQPPVFNPELGPAPQPEFQMPLKTETANLKAQRVLDKRRELLARRAATQDPVELAAIEAELNDPVRNPVVHAPPAVEQRVQHGQFAKPGYTAVDTPVTESLAPATPPVAPEPYTPEAAAARAAQPVAPPQAVSDQPHVSAIANRFTEERAARGEIGEVAPGGTISTTDLVAKGMRMGPERVNEAVSRIMQGGDITTNDAAAIRGEEARLSQRSNELSRAAQTSPEAQLAADNAFKDLTDFHNGPVAALKRNWHLTGKAMQGEIPVDLSTLNGLREAWFKDTGQPPPAHVEPMLRRTADRVARSISDEKASGARLGQEIERTTRGRRMPSVDEVRNNIAERMGVEPCIT